MPDGMTEAVGIDVPDSGPLARCEDSCMALTETDHRVANHLSMLSSYVRLGEKAFTGRGPVARRAVTLFARGIEAQIRSVARLHRHLMTNRGRLSSELAAILGDVCQSYASAVPGCTIVSHLDADCVVEADALLPLAQLVNEAIANAMKHAFRDHLAGEIAVSCGTGADGAVQVDICDNGPGLPGSFDPERDGGFGFSLMRTLAHRLGAALTFHSSPEGLRVCLSLPSPQASTDAWAGSGAEPRPNHHARMTKRP